MQFYLCRSPTWVACKKTINDNKGENVDVFKCKACWKSVFTQTLPKPLQFPYPTPNTYPNPSFMF